MKAKYLGYRLPDDDGPRRVGFAGKSFPRGHFVDVSDVSPVLQGKLRTNPNFEVSDEPVTAEEAAALDELNGALEASDAAKADAADGDGAGDKASVLGALEALQAKHPELTFSPKWGLAKLKGALEAARFEYGDDD